jgi:hypothetical protein
MAEEWRVWFRRLADAPRVDYVPLLAVDRSRLPGTQAVPRTVPESSYVREGRLEWPDPDGWYGISPAKKWGRADEVRDLDASEALQRLTEALELPGTPVDYHFLVQSGMEALWAERRDQTWVLPVVEQLAWVSVRLGLEFRAALSSLGSLMPVLAFHQLITMYLREGWVREAVHVLELAERYYGRPWHRRDEILSRLHALDAEPHE